MQLRSTVTHTFEIIHNSERIEQDYAIQGLIKLRKKEMMVLALHGATTVAAAEVDMR